MEMVWHQAIGVRFGYRGDIQPVLFEKVAIVLRLAKHVFEPVGVVENVIAGMGLKGVHLIFSYGYNLPNMINSDFYNPINTI
jgi:hypothetical protein